jgi:ADP-heptose:LPS heptosyltransferase
MNVRTQRKIDNYVGRIGIAILRPLAMLLGRVLRRDHRLEVKREAVWVKLLGGGSLLLAMPTLLGFRRAHPAVRMILITTPGVKPFAELMGVFDEYRIIDNRGALALLRSAAVALVRTFRADCIVDLEVHSRLTTVFTTLTMARNRVSFWLEDIFWRRGLSSHLIFFNRSSGSFHFYDRIADLFGVTTADRNACRTAVLGASGVSEPLSPQPGRVCVGFSCSELSRERMLSPEQWVQAFRDNLRPDIHTAVLLGARADRETAEAIITALRSEFPHLVFENWCGELSLRQSVAKLCEMPEFWGIDSSLLHLARLAGLRCVSYWGPTNPAMLLRDSWTVEETIHYRKIACSPCVHTSEEPPCHGNNQCIRGLFAASDIAPAKWTPMELPPERTRTPLSPRGLLAGAWRSVGFLCVVGVLVYCLIHAFDPPRLNWGDSASDYNAMTAGRNFQKYGFLNLRLTPFVLDPAVMTEADKAMIYTHYPQLPDLMNGVLRTVFGMTDLVQFRFVALAFSFCALWFVYQLLRAYWSRETAQYALALWVINPLWIQHADYLHHLPYAAFFGFGSLYFLVRYLRDGERWGFLAASGAFVFFVFMASYDYWFFAPLIIATITLAHYRSIRWPAIRVLGILGACAVAAILSKWATNAWALGGVQAFIQDMRFQAVERATNKAVKVAYHNGLWPTLTGRVERCFTYLLFPVAAFWALYPLLRRRWSKRVALLATPIANPAFLLLAALPFLIVFSELWVGQYYPTTLVLPFYAVASAALVAMLLRVRSRPAKAIGVTLFAALAINSIGEDATFKKAFFDRDAIRTLKTELDAVSHPGQQILVDHVFDAAYRYYFSHNTVALILNPPYHYAGAVAYYSDPTRARVAPASGAIFVQHKHLTDEMFDKGYYYILGRAGLWGPWGNPERYHSELDTFIARRDSELVAEVAKQGDKISETAFYAVWRLRPSKPQADTAAAVSDATAKHETHLAEIEGQRKRGAP